MHDQKPWWEEPYRIVQTNLRLTDADLDPEALAKQAKAFGASAITFNVGGIYAFYPTELSLHATNPFLKGDLTGAMLKAAHDHGLKMVGRFDLSKGTRLAYEAHPEWFVHNERGEPQEYNGTYQACVNGGWSLDYGHRILREGLERYDLDGAFFNMTGYQPYDYGGEYRGICHCQNCQQGFADMFGRRLPMKEDFSDPAYADYLAFKRRTSVAAAQRIYDTVKEIRPSTGVMGNGRGACDFMRLEIQRAVARPAPEWPHQPGELARWGAAIGQGKTYSCASTNFLDYQWRYASETSHNHMLRFGQQIASGAQIDYYVLGTFEQENREPLEPVKRFLHWHAANGDYLTDTRSLARVALYHSRVNAAYAGATLSGKLQNTAFRGAYRLLLESRIPFDFLSDERMADDNIGEALARYDVILLPAINCLSDNEAKVLDEYVSAGGTVLMTGETGHYDERGQRRMGFALKSAPATSIVHTAKTLETYFRIAEGETDLADTKLVHLHGYYFHTEPRDGIETALKLLPQPRYGPPELCYLEGEPTEHPGVMTRECGQGRTVHLPWLPEWHYFRDGLPEHREILRHLIDRASQRPVRIEGAGPVEVTVRERMNKAGERVVHIVNYAGQRQSAYDEPPVLTGLRLGIPGAVEEARALVSGEALAVGAADADGYAWIDLPGVKFFEVVVLSGAAA
ncbi:alpha-amylase family protein [Novosphingobium sp. RD2P27]|uniref:Alpha-amylase family protein n=1 Tax=Novosphingobium kalidii TaxID=3230299 RepID=A0ABV2D3F5_9SPHN